jgi:hypothetical protein
MNVNRVSVGERYQWEGKAKGEDILGVKMMEVYIIFIYEDCIMNLKNIA